MVPLIVEAEGNAKDDRQCIAAKPTLEPGNTVEAPFAIYWPSDSTKTVPWQPTVGPRARSGRLGEARDVAEPLARAGTA